MDGKTEANEGQRPEQQSTPYLAQNMEKGSSPETHPAPEQATEAANIDLETASTVQNKPISVPRTKRRGLLASFTILAEVDDPYLYSYVVKWFITFVVAFTAAATSLGSAIIYREL